MRRGPSTKVVQLRVATSVRRLRQALAFSRGGKVERSTLTYRIRRGARRTVYLAWINYPAAAGSGSTRPATSAPGAPSAPTGARG